MPYIAMKSFPKDQAVKETFVERLNDLLLEVWGCRQEAITISIEEVAPADWEEQVMKAEVEPNRAHMMMLSGQRCYKAE